MAPGLDADRRYVRFAGDSRHPRRRRPEDHAPGPDRGGREISRYFHFKPIWQRAIIVAAGPIANFLLAITIFAALLMALGEWVVPARIAVVEPNTAAAAAGFKPAT